MTSLESHVDFGYDWPFVLHVKYPNLYLPVLEYQKKKLARKQRAFQSFLKNLAYLQVQRY